MAVSIALFRSEGGAYFEDSLQASAHAQLLEQLRGLVQESRTVKVLHWKQISSAFGRRGDNFRRMRFNKALGDEVLSAVLQDLAPQSEHGVHMGSPKVEEAVVQTGVEFNLDVVSHAQRERCLGAGDDIDGGGQDFVSRGRCWFALLHLGRALERYGTGELERGFPRHSLNGVQGLFPDVIGLEENLSFARAVSEVNKTNRTLAAVGFHEADHGDIFPHEFGTMCLQFTERVRAVGGGNPSGHDAGVEAQNMNHSLGKVG